MPDYYYEIWLFGETKEGKEVINAEKFLAKLLDEELAVMAASKDDFQEKVRSIYCKRVLKRVYKIKLVVKECVDNPDGTWVWTDTMYSTNLWTRD